MPDIRLAQTSDGTGPPKWWPLVGALFRTHIEPQMLDAIRCATNDGAILGHAQFREYIEAALQRRVTRLAHGGDRRSEVFQSFKESQ